MAESLVYGLVREYLILTVTYSLIAALLVELLLWTWQIDDAGARIKFRLIVLLLPLTLALAYPLARSVHSLYGGFDLAWRLLDTEALIQMIHRYFPWLWVIAGLVLIGTTAHSTFQVVIPSFRRPESGLWCKSRPGAASQDTSMYPSLSRAYASVADAAGFSPKLVLVDSKEPAAKVEGAFSPSIVVSTALLRLLDEEELEGVLAHEFAHISRADIALNWLATALRTLMFYNPVATLVHTLIALDTERVCDDVATSVVSKPLAYASALVKIHRATTNASGNRSGLTARERASLAIRVSSWEARALHAFTVGRIRRVMEPIKSRQVSYMEVRLGLAVAALAAILWLVT